MFVRVVLGDFIIGATESALVAVTPTPDVTVSRETLSPGKTLLLLVGIGLGALAAYVLMWVALCTSPCMA
jgi:hypothetical protein